LRVVALLPFFYGLVFPNLVRNRACSGSCGAPDQGSFASSVDRAEYGSASGCSTYNLCAGVFLMIFIRLLAFRAIMCGLPALTVLLVLRG
jgi:hypothetical protein